LIIEKWNSAQTTRRLLIRRKRMPDKYYFLKVGCADCTVMHLGNKVVMVDCHQGDSVRGEADILDYIRNDKIDVLIITHQHYDHFDGIQVLIDNEIEVVELWECMYDRRYNDGSVDYDEWQYYQRLRNKLGAKIYRPTRSAKNYDTVGGAGFQILNPQKNINTDDSRELHDASLVFDVGKGTMTVSFTGDASDKALKEVCEYFSLKERHVLHASHHGSLNGAYLDFIKARNPNYTIVSTKSGVHDNVPHPTALQRYRNHSRKAMRRTDIDGTRTFTIGG
jgi:beta-lactamase superfamily II metal-dependent hydrolase